MPKWVPINYISTTKQALFDIIIAESTRANLHLLSASAYLVKGDYETIYKMMVNREMILGAQVECYDDGNQTVYQWLTADFRFVNGKTVGSKPVIQFINYAGQYRYIDCNNIIYKTDSDIPFDGKENDPIEPGSDETK